MAFAHRYFLDNTCLDKVVNSQDSNLIKFKNEGKAKLPLISSSCPAVVKMIKCYYPELRQHLAPVLSPMQAHGKYLQAKYPEAKVVFIGPCAAKKEEAEEREYIDLVLTFSELQELKDELVKKDKIILEAKNKGIEGESRKNSALFPAAGGLFKAAELVVDEVDSNYLTVTGLANLQQLFSSLQHLEKVKMVEALACSGGCLGGAFYSQLSNVWQKRQVLVDKVAKQKDFSLKDKKSIFACIDYLPGESKDLNNIDEPKTDDIAAILAETGKYTKEDKLNCGACGYETCEDKAKAVYFGWAEVEMCLPYMRQRAESMANRFLQSVPSGVVLVNSNLIIEEVNPRVLEMFNKQGINLKGQALEKLIGDIADFVLVLDENKQREGKINYQDRIFEQLIFPIKDDNLIVGVFNDITETEMQKKDLQKLKEETLHNAQKIINKQMRVAQEIAGLLGETTAETKVSLSHLQDLIKGEGDKLDH